MSGTNNEKTRFHKDNKNVEYELAQVTTFSVNDAEKASAQLVLEKTVPSETSTVLDSIPVGINHRDYFYNLTTEEKEAGAKYFAALERIGLAKKGLSGVTQDVSKIFNWTNVKAPPPRVVPELDEGPIAV